MIYNLLQLLGGIILSFGQIPQIAQIIRTKSARDLNLKTYVMMLTGILMMEVYGVNLVLHGSGGAFLITNSISMLASVVMVILVLKYRKNSPQRLDSML
jgi:MtN3 and saliva related transmembrane protein